MALRDKELKAAKAQLQRRDSGAARAVAAAAEAEAALAAAKGEVRRAVFMVLQGDVIVRVPAPFSFSVSRDPRPSSTGRQALF